jgi:hypothetical protein
MRRAGSWYLLMSVQNSAYSSDQRRGQIMKTRLILALAASLAFASIIAFAEMY